MSRPDDRPVGPADATGEGRNDGSTGEGRNDGSTDDGPGDGSTDPPAGEPVLAVEGLSVSYGRVAALRDVDLHVGAGEVVAVIGPNGAGKSTLADAVSGLREYDGSVRFEGVEVAARRPPELVRDGLVHCTETRDLFGYMTVEDNLRLGAYRHAEGLAERLSFVYEVFPALAGRTDQHARTMSGGEQQMLAVGRALMADPVLLVLDEPTLGLAPLVRETIGEVLPTVVEAGVSVLLCEQNVSFALSHADRVYLLENGRVERAGTPATLRGDEYVREAYLGR